MTSLDENETVYVEDRHDEDVDGVVNPSFIEEQIIQTRGLEPGVTANRAFSQSSSSLPDILNSHLPPPYEAVVVDNNSRRRQRQQSGMTEKSCCRSCWTSVTRFKWLLWTLSLMGIGCVTAGVVLGALYMSGSSFMTLSIMFIGLGVIMIVVVLVGWRCTPRGHEPCHLLFNLGEYSRRRRRHGRSSEASGPRSGRRREHQSQGRRTFWSGGVIYSDNQYRQPPPSYAAAMQDFERQLLARMNNIEPLPNSPPPTYKSQASLPRPAMRSIFPEQPPTYSSRAGTLRTAVVERNNLNHETSRGETGLSVTNVILHHDNISRYSVDDNLSYPPTGLVETDRTSERPSVHTSGLTTNEVTTDGGTLHYGTVERCAVQFLEESIQGGEGVVNTSMVLDGERGTIDDRTRYQNDNNDRYAQYHADSSEMNSETADRLRAADQNLRSRLEAFSILTGRTMPGCAELRFGSARSSTQRDSARVSHLRSSSTSRVDFQDHIATLV